MTHDERIHQLLYSNEGRVEQCERICKLEELLRFALLRCNADNPMCDACTDGYNGVCELEQRMFELGVIE